MKLLIAFYYCIKAHYKQFDKGGKWYVLHPLTVSWHCKKYNEKILALLHDVVEDSNIKISDISSHFSDEIIEALNLITKTKGISYDLYLEKIKNNKLARNVKIEDIKHNMNLKRLKNITDKDIKRYEKYKKSLEFLKS